MKMNLHFVGTTLCLLCSSTVFASEWKLNPSSSKIQFQTSGAGGVNAQFNQLQGQIYYDPKHLEQTKLYLEINASSLSAGFKTPIYKSSKGLDVRKYPKLVFKSTSVTPVNATQLKMQGLLTMHGITKATTWNVYLKPTSQAHSPLTLNGSTIVDRTEWGLNDFENLIDHNILLKANLNFSQAH